MLRLASIAGLVALFAIACAPPAPPPEAEPKEVGNPESGRELFVEKGCGGCHVVAAVPEATGQIGPELDGVAARAEERVPELTAEEYLRQAIREPEAFVVPGFSPGVMPRIAMTPDEENDVVAFLLTLE